MLELTEQQVQALEQSKEPPILMNPKTQEGYVLIRKDVFDLLRKWMEPLNRAWDDPALDVYNDTQPQP